MKFQLKDQDFKCNVLVSELDGRLLVQSEKGDVIGEISIQCALDDDERPTDNYYLSFVVKNGNSGGADWANTLVKK